MQDLILICLEKETFKFGNGGILPSLTRYRLPAVVEQPHRDLHLFGASEFARPDFLDGSAVCWILKTGQLFASCSVKAQQRWNCSLLGTWL